jgi:hypothetical protein
MRKAWRTVTALALLGFAINAGFYGYACLFFHFANPSRLDLVVTTANMVLSPPVLLFIWCIDCEAGTWAGFTVFLIAAGVLNAGLYATIGAAVTRRQVRLNEAPRPR